MKGRMLFEIRLPQRFVGTGHTLHLLKFAA